MTRRLILSVVLGLVGFIGVLATLIAALATPGIQFWGQVACWILFAVFVLLLLGAGVLVLPAGVLVVLWYCWVRLRPGRAYFAKTFVKYCRACEAMVRGAKGRDGIITIQTPYQYNEKENDERAFDSYLNATLARIIPTNLQYRRLVVLGSAAPTKGVNSPEEKMKYFLSRLIREAALRAEKDDSFDLKNVSVAFVLEEALPRRMYSNIDIHMTSPRDFAVAFLPSLMATGLQERFSAVHIRDDSKEVAKDLSSDVEAAWEWADHKGYKLSVPDIWDHEDDPTSPGKQRRLLKAKKAEIDAILEKLKQDVDTMAARVRAQAVCARSGKECPFVTGPHAIPGFLVQLAEARPTAFAALKNCFHGAAAGGGTGGSKP